MMLIIASLLLAGFGAVVFVRGVRGRRVGDRQFCRRCGYDVTSRPADSGACSECGADLSSARGILAGERVRSRPTMRVGIALLVVALIVFIPRTIHRLQQIHWIEYRPTSWLIADIRNGHASRADIENAFTELLRRVTARSMSKSSRAILIAAALTEQANHLSPWDSRWGLIVESEHRNNALPEQDWARYLRQAITLTLITRPKISIGNPLPFECTVDHPRTADTWLEVKWQWRALSFESSPPSGPAANLDVKKFLQVVGQNATGAGGAIDGESTRTLRPGKARLNATLDLAVITRDSWTDQRQATPSTLLASLPNSTVAATFDVVEREDDVPYETRNTELAPAMRAAVHSEAFAHDSLHATQLEANFIVGPAPVTICANVFARFPNGHERFLGWRMMYAGLRNECWLTLDGEQSLNLSATDAADEASAQRVDICFRPAHDGIRLRIKDEPVWGETIEVTDVQIERIARPHSRPPLEIER